MGCCACVRGCRACVRGCSACKGWKCGKHKKTCASQFTWVLAETGSPGTEQLAGDRYSPLSYFRIREAGSELYDWWAGKYVSLCPSSLGSRSAQGSRCSAFPETVKLQLHTGRFSLKGFFCTSNPLSISPGGWLQLLNLTHRSSNSCVWQSGMTAASQCVLFYLLLGWSISRSIHCLCQSKPWPPFQLLPGTELTFCSPTVWLWWLVQWLVNMRGEYECNLKPLKPQH